MSTQLTLARAGLGEQRWRMPAITASLLLVAPVAGMGLAMQALLLAFVLLYVNVPAGHDMLLSLSWDSVPLFRALWPYPTLKLDLETFGVRAMDVMLALWAVYGGVVALIWRNPALSRMRATVVTIFVGAVISSVILVVALPPVLSGDVYHYGLFGRMVAFYGLNPYTTTGNAVAADPIWPLVYWRDVTTHYGPVWTVISAAGAAVGGNSVPGTVLVFKGVAALFNLANCVLVFLLARRLTGGSGVLPLLLYAWNPLVLIETAGSGHNDVAMMTFALGGLLLAVRGRLLLAIAVLIISTEVKYATTLLALFVAAHALAQPSSWRGRVALGSKMLGVVAVPLLLYLPFWAPAQTRERLFEMFTPMHSPVRVALRDAVAGVLAANEIQPAKALAEVGVVWALHAVFLALVLALAAWLLLRGGRWERVIACWGASSLMYVAVVYAWTYPWYVLLPLTTTAAAVHTRANKWILASTCALGGVLMLGYTVPAPS